MSKVQTYFKESYEELVTKTSWPTWAELQKTAALVAGASIIIALVIALMDFGITKSLEGFYELFK